MNNSYKIAEQVIGETINNESIVLNFETGIYYHFKGSAALIWTQFENGISVNLIASIFLPSEKLDIKKEIFSFITFLLEDNLIVLSDADPTQKGRSDIVEFKSPEYQKYTDMKDLLELDPIHELYHH